jgi:hypothetical protein
MHRQGDDDLMKGQSPVDPKGVPYLFGKELKLIDTLFNKPSGEFTELARKT